MALGTAEEGSTASDIEKATAVNDKNSGSVMKSTDTVEDADGVTESSGDSDTQEHGETASIDVVKVKTLDDADIVDDMKAKPSEATGNNFIEQVQTGEKTSSRPRNRVQGNRSGHHLSL